MQVWQPAHQRKACIKVCFVLSRSRDISFMKKIESLFKIAGMKFEFQILEICFYKRWISFGCQNCKE